MFSTPTRFPGVDSAGARIMANAWTDAFVALWRGEASASIFAEWLATYRDPTLDLPTGEPDATCPYGMGDGGMTWFERDGWVSGHVPGQPGGYLLPRETVLEHPWVSLIAAAA